MIAPKVGDRVAYTLEDGPCAGAVRPAVIVRTWGKDPLSAVQLVVFVDGTNDGYPDGRTTVWKTSRQQAEEPTPGRWHCFPEEA